jgi:hypothetical protein
VVRTSGWRSPYVKNDAAMHSRGRRPACVSLAPIAGNLARVYPISFNDAFLSLNRNFSIEDRRVSRKRHGFPAEVTR